MGALLSFLSENSQTILGTLGLVGGYLFHTKAAQKVANQNSVLDSGLQAITHLLDSYVQTTGATTVESLRVQLKGLAAVQLAKVGVYEGSALWFVAQAGISAAIEKAVNAFVTAHPAKSTLKV